MLIHMARPPLKDRDMLKAVRMELKASTAQHARWLKAASSMGCTLSKWARLALDRAARTGN
jgi:hypothetical protein